MIPGYTKEAFIKLAAATATVRPTRYKIQKGDNLEKLSKRFFVDLERLKKANINQTWLKRKNGNPLWDKIQIGDELIIPEDDRVYLKNTTGRDYDWKPNFNDPRYNTTLDRIQLQESSGGRYLRNSDNVGYAYGPWQTHITTYKELIKEFPELRKYPHEALQDPRIARMFMLKNMQRNLIRLNRDPNVKGSLDDLLKGGYVIERMHRAGYAGRDKELAHNYVKLIDGKWGQYNRNKALFSRMIPASTPYSYDIIRRYGYPVYNEKRRRLYKPWYDKDKKLWIYSRYAFE